MLVYKIVLNELHSRLCCALILAEASINGFCVLGARTKQNINRTLVNIKTDMNQTEACFMKYVYRREGFPSRGIRSLGAMGSWMRKQGPFPNDALIELWFHRE